MYDRRMTVGASDAVHIQAGDWAVLWDRKNSTGASEWPLARRIGHALEDMHREWFTEQTGIQVQPNEYVEELPHRLKDHDWCTYLDDGLIIDPGLTEIGDLQIPFEMKNINMMWNPDNLLRKYMPQLQHAMRVMDAPYAIFSVIYLNVKWEFHEIKYDPPYDDALFEKEKLFHWFQTENVRPPEYKGKRKGWVT